MTLLVTTYLPIDAGVEPVNRIINHKVVMASSAGARRQLTSNPSDSTLGETAGSDIAEPIDTRTMQVDAEEYAAFQAYRARRRQASLSFETQGTAKRLTPSLKTKDPKPYKGETPEELDDFLYECERQFDAKGFTTEEDREGETPADRVHQKEDTKKKVAYATGFLEERAKTDWKSWLLQFPLGADSWTHFKTLLREFLEGDKEEAYAEGSQKLTNARQRKGDSVNEYYDYTYKLHIRLRALDKERSFTDQQFFDYFRARLLQEYRIKLDELIPGPKTMHELLHQVHRYEKTARTHAQKDGHKDKSRSEGSTKPQDSKKDNKSGRAANHDQKKNRDDKDSSTKAPFVMWKDKLSDDVRDRRWKDQACFKCGLPGHKTRDCTAKDQTLHDSQAMLEAAKNK